MLIDKMKLIVLNLLFVGIGIICGLNEDLIKDFFVAKHTSHGVIFGCSSYKELALNQRKLSQLGLRLSIFNLYNENLYLCSILYTTFYHLSIVVDGNCEEVNLFLEECGELVLFTENRHWLVVSNNESILDVFKLVNLNVNADLNVAISLQDNKNSWNIFDVFNPAFRHGGELKINLIGEYNKNNGYPTSSSLNRYWRRKNFTGTSFKSAIVIPQPIYISIPEYIANQEQRENNSQHRFQATTVNICRDFFNFTLNIRRIDSWGYIQNSTGRFNGMVGLLEQKVIDFGSSPLLYKLDRMPVVGYSFGNWILKSTFIYRPPPAKHSSLVIFLQPLSASVWILTFLVSIATLFVLRMILFVEKTSMKNFKESFEISWSFISLFIIAAYCQQGLETPDLSSGRVLSLTLLLFAFIIYQFYAGYIVSYLLMDPPRIINTLEDLFLSSLAAGIEDILIDRDYFVQTTDPIAIKLYDEKLQTKDSDGFYEPEIGLELVKEGGFAFHVEVSTAYPIIKKTFPPKVICELEEVQMYRTQPMHTNLQKNSPFLEMFNYCMLRQVEHGIMHRLRSYWDAKRPECIEGDHEKEITVGIDELLCAVVILAAGIIFSLNILICEILFHKFEKHITAYKHKLVRKFYERRAKYPFTN